MAMPLLLPHVRVLDQKYPPREAYAPRIDVSPPHWYWDGDFFADPFSRTPVFRWSPEGHPHTGVYVVARLLWCDANPGEHRRLKLRNTCGVYGCIDPSHWEDVDRPRRFTLPDDSVDLLVRAPHHRRGLVVRDRAMGSTVLVHIRSLAAYHAVCGLSFDGRVVGLGCSTVDKGSVITCEECLKEWQGLGRPLKELP